GMTLFERMMAAKATKSAPGYPPWSPATSWIKVVESATVPKTKPQGGMFLTVEGGEAAVEPIGDRIIETPVSARDTEFLRNPRSGFIAYVPPGSLKKGEDLVRNGVTGS